MKNGKKLEKVHCASPGRLAWERILRHRPTLIALSVFTFILILCWAVPVVWPHSGSTTHLSLGASPPMATIYELTPLEEGESGDRLVTLERAQRLRQNALEALGMPTGPADAIPSGKDIIWVELPLVLTRSSGEPFLPVWLAPTEMEAYQEFLKENLPVEDAAWADAMIDYTQAFTVEKSPLWFLVGTDELGRDLWVRILEGGRLSIAVGFAATLVSITIGILYGGLSGYCGGKVDSLLMRIVDVLYALPFLIFVILLMALFPRSLLLLFLAIGAVEWLTTARIVRGEILALRKLPFVDAARCLGLSHWRILRHHLLPNTIPPVIVYATLTVPTVILLESVLSFLGLGVQPPASSWGVLISEGADRMETYPWMLLYPSLIFATTLLSLNFLGDGLRDLLDPKTKD